MRFETLLYALLLFSTASGVASAASRAQGCINPAGELLDACEPELNLIDVSDKLPLTVAATPDKAKIRSLVADLPASLPTVHCCAAVAKFRDRGCGCVSGLAKAISAAIFDVTTPGFQGAVALLATACSCPACAPLQAAPNATATVPAVQAADKPGP